LTNVSKLITLESDSKQFHNSDNQSESCQRGMDQKPYVDYELRKNQPYQCKECHKNFDTKVNLKQHTKRV
jgi:hypothetical protein